MSVKNTATSEARKMLTRSKIRIQPGTGGKGGTTSGTSTQSSAAGKKVLDPKKTTAAPNIATSDQGRSTAVGTSQGRGSVPASNTVSTTATNVAAGEQNWRSTGGGDQGRSVPASGRVLPHAVGQRVAYLEPQDYSKESPRQPVAVGKALHEVGFNGYEEIYKIGKFRYKLDLKSSDDFGKLQKLDLKRFNLKVFLPASHKETICFVPNVPLDFGDDEMKEQMECEFPITRVERIMRMGRNRQLIKTTNLKVTVQGTEVPRAVKVYGCGFRAELYLFPVKQCSKCWMYGHTKKVCRGEAVCENCGAKNCGSECHNRTQCRNCKKEHGAADRECPERVRRKAIVQEMAKKRIPFAEAEKSVISTSNRFAALADERSADPEDATAHGAVSYAFMASRRNRRKSNPPGPHSDTEDDQPNPGATRNSNRSNSFAPTLENVHKATEFEAFIDMLRKLFLQHLKAKAWLAPLIKLRDKISNTLNSDNTGIELDTLLIEISTELNNIIETESHNNEQRIENESQHG